MTTTLVVIVGILGTILLGYVAYRHWASPVPVQRTKPTLMPASAAAQPMAPPTPPPHVPPTRNKKRWLLWLVVILLLAVGVGAYKMWADRSRVGSSDLTSSRLSAEIALPVIAQCESGGRQFEADGKTPLRNREGSSAIGKYQIMASLHEERAKRLGYDIRTEAGNEAFAYFLYAESGTQHWEADPRSRACWEPRLLARGRSTPLPTTHPTTDTTFIVKVQPGQPAEVVMPPNWMIVWWGNKARFTSHAVWRGSDKVRVFSVRPGVGSADIKIHRYHDPDPNWWRRQ